MSDSYNPAEAKQENTTFSPTDIKISTAGSTFIAQWEKFKPNVYLDAAKRPTIGFGHLLRPGESYANGITYEDALKLLKEDLATAENSVSRNVISNLSQNQYDALVSLTYNIGNGAFKDSTLLRLLNQGDYQGAADQFLRWNKITVDGKVMESAGLANRRASEKELFESGAYD